MNITNLSLFDFCIPCGAKCCKSENSAGSPILSESEVKKIEAFCKKKFGKKSSAFKKVVAGKDDYYIFAKFNENACPFLNSGCSCRIQEVKPLDCAAYPLKAIYSKENKVKFIIDPSCPAVNDLSKEFLEESKIIAIESLKRFSPGVYLHWLGKLNFEPKELEI